MFAQHEALALLSHRLLLSSRSLCLRVCVCLDLGLYQLHHFFTLQRYIMFPGGGNDTGLGECGKKRPYPDVEHLETSISKKLFPGQGFEDTVTFAETNLGSSIQSRESTAHLSGLFNKAKEELGWQKHEFATVNSETSLGSSYSIMESHNTDAWSTCASTDGVVTVDSSDGRVSRDRTKLSGTVLWKDSSYSHLISSKGGKLDVKQSGVPVSRNDGINSPAYSSLTSEDELSEDSGVSRTLCTRIQGERLAKLRPLPEDITGGDDCASFSGRQQLGSYSGYSAQRDMCRDHSNLLAMDGSGSSCQEPTLKGDEPTAAGYHAEKRFAYAVDDSCRHGFTSVVSPNEAIIGCPTVLQEDKLKGVSVMEGIDQSSLQTDGRSNDSCQGETSDRLGRTLGGVEETSSVPLGTDSGPDSIELLSQAGLEKKDTDANPQATFPNYVLSSGRLSQEEEARLGKRAPTIDQDFEEYFSALML